MHTRAGVVLLAIALGACRTVSVGQAPALIAFTRLFGPVISHEVIAGKVQDGGDVVLLVGQAELLRINVSARRATRTLIGVPPAEQCWGLGRLADGSLWTLKGRRAAVRIAPDGSVLAERALTVPHVGLFAVGDRLVYQSANVAAGSPALHAAPPGPLDPFDNDLQPWSSMTARAFDGLDRAAASALNLVSCGLSRFRERACWFPDEGAVYLVDASGETRRVPLSGPLTNLDVLPPETLLAAENPRRPVRDAYVDGDGVLWILSTGAPAQGRPEQPGGWVLAAYSPDGSPRGRGQLPEPARALLGADRGRILLLTTSGYVVEADPW